MNTLENFPPLVICFACDIQEGDTVSGYVPAEDHLGSEEWNPLYGLPRIEGYAALHRLTNSRMLIPGKDEKRFKGRMIEIDGKQSLPWQGYLIRKILIEDYGCDPARIDWVPSTGSTNNAAEAARKYLEDNDIVPQEGIVEFTTSFYHCVRTASRVLRRAKLPVLLTPAEAFTVAEAILHDKQREAEDRLRSFGGHFMDPRIIIEIRGIALDLLGKATRQTKGWQ